MDLYALLLERDPHEERSDGLRHGEGDEARPLRRVVAIGLVDDAPVFHDQQRIGVGALDELFGRVGLAGERIGEIEGMIRSRQRPHGAGAPDHARGEQLVHVVEDQTVHIRIQHRPS